MLAGTRTTVLPYSASGYRYKVVPHGAEAGFEALNFNDVAAGFSTGTAAFASSTCGGAFNTSWTGINDILLRRTVSLPGGSHDVRVSVAIDNDIQVFWNGVDISGGMRVSESCAVPDEWTFTVPAAALDAGDNLLAARARNRSTASHVNLMVTAEVTTAPTSCADEDLSTTVAPQAGGRVTVVYDPRYLVDPAATADYLADAERIARHVQDRAEDALARYDVLLGSTPTTSHTPPHTTIEIRCELRAEIFVELPVSDIDAPGYTGDWDDVQLRSAEVRDSFAAAVTGPRDENGDFSEGDWDSPPAEWASTVDHEIFHTVQHFGQSAMGADYIIGPDASNIEAAATVAQDLFLDADDDDAPADGSYWRMVQTYFSRPVPLTVDVPTRNKRNATDPYAPAPVIQYLGEQYGGPGDPDWERRVADFLHRMIVSDETRIQQLQDAMLSEFDTVDEAIRDFAIAAYVNDRPDWRDYPARYVIADEAHSHLGEGVGTDYPTFRGITGPAATENNDLTLGGQVILDEPIGEGEGRVFEIDIDDNVLLAELYLTASNRAKPDPEHDGAAVAILPVNSDGSVEVAPAYLPRLLVEAEYQEPVTFPVGGLSKLAVVVGSTAKVAQGAGEPVYELRVSDQSNFPEVQIVPPSDEPRSIGSAPDFNLVLVRALPLSNGEPVLGLSAAAFDVEIGGLPATIHSGVRVDPEGVYWLVVQAPPALAPGAHDLTLTLANVTSDTAAGAIIVEESAGFAALSSTTGLTDFLALETIAEVGTPIQVRYILADRSSAVTGATVTATVTAPGGAEHSATLVDDGGHNDGGADDGVYGAALWSSEAVGDHTVTISASGVDSADEPFNLIATDSVSLAPKTDLDGDGIADAIEPWYQLDPTDGTDGAGDADGDGRTIGQELVARTDPFLADSDGGGEADGSEVANARDPLDAADDGNVSGPTLTAVLRDASTVELRVATEDGSGSVRLTRTLDGTATSLGNHPGAGTVLTDGPLASGDYVYTAVAVGQTGAESAPHVVGPVTPVADATPPDGYLVVNGGPWRTADTEVSVEFAELSEPVSEMRLALSSGELEEAAWVPFQAASTFTLPADLGLHTVYAQVRDAAGNESRTLSAIAVLVDLTPPSSTAGPLPAVSEAATINVPFTANDDLSGVETVTVWWRHRQTATGAWSVWQAGPSGSSSPITFPLSAGSGFYEFYSIAADAAGNVESAPATADAATEHPDPTRPWAWGSNTSGKLGSATTQMCGSTPCSSTPLQTRSLVNVVAVAAGGDHSMALQADGTVWTWGENGLGQLGIGTTTDSAVPVRVTTLSNVQAIAAGRWISLARRSDGTLWAWGVQNGGLGNGTATSSTRPVQVAGLTNVIAMEAGDDHSLAVTADGKVWAWGWNNFGQLSGNKGSAAVPFQVASVSGAVAVAAGARHSLALTSGGAVYAWGSGSLGQLGLGSTQDKSRATQIGSLANVVSISTTEHHSLAARANGSVWAWGWNSNGQLGDGTTTQRNSPVQSAGVSGATAVVTGGAYSIALLGDGSLWGWGSGTGGQLDNGTTSSSLVPIPIAAGVAPVETVAGGTSHVLAIRRTE